MVKVKATKGDEVLVEQSCDVAVMFFANGNNLSVSVSGEMTQELIETLKKHIPKALKITMGKVEKQYKQEELKLKAMQKVEEAMKVNKE